MNSNYFKNRIRLLAIILVVGLIIAIVLIVKMASHNKGNDSNQNSQEFSLPDSVENETETEEKTPVFSAVETENTAAIGEEVGSPYAIIVDVEAGEIVAGRNAFERVSPASMTKIMTVLVAAENIDESELDEKVPISFEATDFAYVHDCSVAGFEIDEQVTVRDLFYGTILPSGAEAATELAIKAAGSEEAFIDLMNEKLEELGLSDTAHFTNYIGIYDENHYCTVYDMAVILKTAMDNEWCRDVLSKHVYTSSVTEQHPEGIVMSNLFLRRIEDKECGGEVIGAKTGFVNQSRSCSASYEVSDASGKAYVCVTVGAESPWYCIDDHVAIYTAFAK